MFMSVLLFLSHLVSGFQRIVVNYRGLPVNAHTHTHTQCMCIYSEFFFRECV